MNDRRDLELVLKSHFPLVIIETHEEPRALELLRKSAVNIDRDLHAWSVTAGLHQLELAGTTRFSRYNRDTLSLEPDDGGTVTAPARTRETEPLPALRRIKETYRAAIVVLIDFHPYLDDPHLTRLVKEIAIGHAQSGLTLVLLSHSLTLPAELQRFAARFELQLPDGAALERLINDEAAIWSSRNGKQPVRADRAAFRQLVRQLQGLTITDATRLIRNAIYDDGALTNSDLPEVMKAKYDLLGGDGVLTFEYDTARLADIGGFAALKRWLELRRAAFVGEVDLPLDPPKGILLLGVQGGGKSLAAKAVAGTWGVPLIRLDFGRLYNKFFGETERNIRDSLKSAEMMAPCVLWLDEIEKGIATGDNDNGTSRRVLGTLLTWMAENRRPVFVVATANDIRALPPELVRKGRMDEIFFADLPDETTRAEIFAIHLRKRAQDPASFDLPALAAACGGFSGAEIEQAVVSALYAVHALQVPLTTQGLLDELRQTRPLSTVMGEQIAALRTWAAGRTVPV